MQRLRSRTPLKDKNSHKSPIQINEKMKKKVAKSLTLQQLCEDRKNYLNPMMELHYHENPIKIIKGEGQYLIDEHGARYLDCANNVAHVGHANPEVVQKINYQLTQLNTNSRYLHDGVSIYTQKLLSKLPKELCVVTYVNSGSEANDLALQFAKIHTQSKNIVCIDGAYHGHSQSTMDISPYKWNKNYKKPDHVSIAKSPCQYRGEYIGDGAAQKYAQDLDKQLIGKKISAFISEALQSCAGQILPPLDYFIEMYKVVKKHGGVTIMDEVQSGLGRVGKHYWAFQIFDIIPDILVFGKSMGNGFPVACVVTNKEIADSFKKFNINYFNTYGGNAPAMVAASAVFDFVEDNNLQQKASETGDYLRKKLLELQNQFINIGNIRGYGLFYGIDCVKDRITKDFHGELAKFVSSRCREKGVFINSDGVHDNILKIKPPLVFNKDNVDFLCKVLKECFIEFEEIKKKQK